MEECQITLIHPGETQEDDEKTAVFAEVNPIGRDEFQSAGVSGYKAQNQFVIWAAEYDGQPELQHGNKRLTMRRHRHIFKII